MAQHYSPRIVTDNLVMCLDPSQNKSYPTTDLPVKNGLGLWLDAADDTTFSYSSGTAVSQWRDKSGNNFHASQGTVASQPSRSTFQNSRKTVNFDGVNDTVTIPNFSCNSEMSIFVVSNCGTTLLIEHSTDTNNNQGFYFYGGGTGIIYITRTGGSIIYSTNWLSGGYSIASAVNSTGLDLLAYKNGTQQSLTSDGRSSFSNSYVTNTLYIGSRGANSLWSSGPIAEIIIYNRKVSDKERNLIHTYLGQKWGIFNTDRQIFDLSGNNFNFSFNGSNPRYNAKTIVSNFNTTSPYAVSSFGGQNLTSNILNLLYSDHTIEVAFNAKGFRSVYSYDNTFTTQDGQCIVLWTGQHSGLRVFQNTIIYEYWNSQSSTVGIGVSISSYIDKIIYITATRTGNTLRIYINGVLASGPTTVAATTSPIPYSQINIGAAYQGNPTTQGYIWAGQHEYHLLRMYNRQLTDTEVASNYQAFKARFDNNIVRFGLIMELDAGNIYSYAGTGTTWYDVSGNNYNGTLIGSPSYTSNNNGGIIFDSNAKYGTLPTSGLAFGTGQFAIEVWVYSTAAVTNNVIYASQSSNVAGFVALYYPSGLGFALTDFNSVGVRTTTTHQTAVSQNTWYHVVGVRNASNQYIVYVNGVASTTNATATTSLTTAAPQIASNPATTGERFTGTIASLRLYTKSLSDSEVLQNYNATKGRFGL